MIQIISAASKVSILAKEYTGMDERDFLSQAEEMLARIERLVEKGADCIGLDLDIELQAEGVLKLEFENASQIIINRHAAAQEIWIAARTGGFHFRLDGDKWKGTRDDKELLACLSELISLQAGKKLSLAE